MKSISASGHAVPSDSLEILSSAIASQNENGITSIAIGDETMGDEGVVSFCEGLSNVNGGSLESIDFALKGISKVGAKMIGQVFGSSKRLQTLILNRNLSIGDDGLVALCNEALESTSDPFPALRELDLSNCNIGVNGVESLVSCLLGTHEKSNQQARKMDLKLDSNTIGPSACNALKNLIACPSGKCSMLESLSLKNCAIGDEGIAIIANTFLEHQCKYLKTLDLSNNGIGTKGMVVLVSAIKQGRKNIEELNEICLADNDSIGEEGIIALASALNHDPNSSEGNSTLATLDLTNTSCGIGGVTALMKCSSLTSLRLFNNNLGSPGIEAVSSHLIGGHPYIKDLDLGGNRAEGDAVSGLLQSIMKDQDSFENSLRTLELGGNENNDESLFEKARQKRPEIDIAPVKETNKDLPDEAETEA